MRTVFFGTSTFAVPALQALAAASDVRLVVTQPDRPAGRGHRLQPSPVKSAAQALGLPTLEPLRLRDALETLSALEADLFALASYGKIVPQSILDLPRLGALNVHPSLLPLYRGATPLQTQIRDGVERSGVSLMLMDAGLDTGDIVVQRESAIGATETYGALHDRFAELGATLLSEAVGLAARGPLPRTPQAERHESPERIAASLTRPLDKAALEIDWTWDARRIFNHIRSLAPAPGARAELAGERIKILSASRVPSDPAVPQAAVPPGTVLGVAGTAMLVRTGDDALALERLVPPNRGAMDGASFARATAGVRAVS